MSESIFDPTRITDAEEFQPGTLAFDSGDGKGYVYGQAAGAIVANGVCRIEGDGQVTELDTGHDDIGGALGVAVAGALTDNQRGWFQVYGRCLATVAASDAADSLQHSTAVDGRIDDATAGEELTGIRVATTRGATAGTTTCDLFFPTVRGA